MREIESLSETDFIDHPVWRFSGGDTKVSPLKKLPCSNLNGKIVGTYVELSNGDRFPALLGNIELDNPAMTEQFLTLSILKNGKWFHLARYHDLDYETRGPSALEEFLELSTEEVFPIKYDISLFVVADKSCSTGSIGRDPRQRLSMEDLMLLVVPKVIEP